MRTLSFRAVIHPTAGGQASAPAFDELGGEVLDRLRADAGSSWALMIEW
jgi:hypothetical protein